MKTQKSGGAKVEVAPMIDRLLANESGRREITNLARESLKRRRQVIVFEVARQLCSVLQTRGITGGASSSPVSGDAAQWNKIESLSQLRAVVGGRFKNLKERWVEAGFPLREHRGDREGKAAVDPEGWMELSVWINKQGYEVRLAADIEPWLFEVRKSEEE